MKCVVRQTWRPWWPVRWNADWAAATPERVRRGPAARHNTDALLQQVRADDEAIMAVRSAFAPCACLLGPRPRLTWMGAPARTLLSWSRLVGWPGLAQGLQGQSRRPRTPACRGAHRGRPSHRFRRGLARARRAEWPCRADAGWPLTFGRSSCYRAPGPLLCAGAAGGRPRATRRGLGGAAGDGGDGAPQGRARCAASAAAPEQRRDGRGALVDGVQTVRPVPTSAAPGPGHGAYSRLGSGQPGCCAAGASVAAGSANEAEEQAHQRAEALDSQLKELQERYRVAEEVPQRPRMPRWRPAARSRSALSLFGVAAGIGQFTGAPGIGGGARAVAGGYRERRWPAGRRAAAHAVPVAAQTDEQRAAQRGVAVAQGMASLWPRLGAVSGSGAGTDPRSRAGVVVVHVFHRQRLNEAGLITTAPPSPFRVQPPLNA